MAKASKKATSTSTAKDEDTSKKVAKKVPAKKASPISQAKAMLDKALKGSEWAAHLDPKAAKQSSPHLPTGSLIIDHLIGGKLNTNGVPPCPGLPKGKITNLYGHESSGKTTIALTTAATTIKNGGYVCYIDWEHEIVPTYAQALGVPIHDEERFILCQPDTLDEGVAILWTMATAGVDLIVLDSVGAGVPKAYFDKKIEETAEQGRVGMNAAVWSAFLPKLKARINKTGTTVLGISQIRDAINKMGYGDQFTVQGGRAWKFFSAVRMKLQKTHTETASDYSGISNASEQRVVGAKVKAKLDKCKVSPQQGNEEEFYIRWGEGIDDLRSLLEIALAHRLAHKSGSSFSWTAPDGTPIKKAGIDKFRQVFMDDPKLAKALEKQVRPYMGAKMSATTEDDDDDEGDEDLFGEDNADLKDIMSAIDFSDEKAS